MVLLAKSIVTDCPATIVEVRLIDSEPLVSVGFVNGPEIVTSGLVEALPALAQTSEALPLDKGCVATEGVVA